MNDELLAAANIKDKLVPQGGTPDEGCVVPISSVVQLTKGLVEICNGELKFWSKK